MSNIRFITDSGCDLPASLSNEAGILAIPFSIECGGKIYSKEEATDIFKMYELLETSSEIPTTSQITTFEMLAHFNQAYDEGYTDIIATFISSTASATHSSAIMARDDFYEGRPEAVGRFNIYVIDSLSYSVGYGWAVYQAALMHKKGAGVTAVIAYLEDWFSKVEVYLGLYSLKHASKSGRIGTAAGIIGEALGIRPILSLIDGETNQHSKVRGDKAVVPQLVKIAKSKRQGTSDYVVAGGNLPDCSKELVNSMKAALGDGYGGFFQLGTAVSINSGPRAVAIIVQGEPRR